MELRHLRYFVVAAEELNFHRAAERLHVAQPAVSAQIKALEEELDVRLFERTTRSIILTQAGSVFLSHARNILGSAEPCQTPRAPGTGGMLRVGLIPPAASPWLGPHSASISPAVSRCATPALRVDEHGTIPATARG